MTNFLDNNYVYVVLCILIALYAKKTQIKLPKPVIKLFSHTLFKISFLSALVIYFNHKPHVAIIVSIVFVLTFQHIANINTKEDMRYAEVILQS